MRRAALLAAVAVLTGCGGSSTSPREHTTAYVNRVDAAMTAMKAEVADIQQGLVEFSQGGVKPATSARLAGAQATFDRLARRLKRTNPPPQARKLQRLLLELVAQDAALAGELHALTVFDPEFGAALRPLPAANAAAQAKLKAASSPAAVRGAILAYRRTIERALTALRPLQPPALEAPAYHAEIARLSGIDAALAKLLAAVRANDANAALRAEHELDEANVGVDSRANQVAQRNAVRAYNRAVTRVEALQVRIRAERDRLQTAIP